MTKKGVKENGFKNNFNSHAHVERDWNEFSKNSRRLNISTHTLTWSVTFTRFNEVSALVISTHTLTWSVTWVYLNQDSRSMYFNSHAHVERDIHGEKYINIY